MNVAVVRIAIVICTYHREVLLSRALDSVMAQNIPPALAVEVVVVDNSDAGTARVVTEAAGGRSPFPLRWIEAHPANISVARNAGVRAASGADWIGFLDDDQIMLPGWFDAVADGLAQFSCDAFFGAVEAEFEAPDRATPLTRQLFSRQIDAPAGAPLVAMGPDKTRGIALATNNSLFRRAAMLVDTGPFNLDFGNGGGEDYDLLCRMQQHGSRFGWLPAARAREAVPAQRCQRDYLRGRFYAGGQAFAAAVANASANPTRTRWLLRLRALAQLGVLALRLPLASLRGWQAREDHVHTIAGALGKLSFAPIKPIYRDADHRLPKHG